MSGTRLRLGRDQEAHLVGHRTGRANTESAAGDLNERESERHRLIQVSSEDETARFVEDSTTVQMIRQAAVIAGDLGVRAAEHS
jgi:hypothetical protein